MSLTFLIMLQLEVAALINEEPGGFNPEQQSDGDYAGEPDAT